MTGVVFSRNLVCLHTRMYTFNDDVYRLNLSIIGSLKFSLLKLVSQCPCIHLLSCLPDKLYPITPLVISFLRI